MNYTDIPLDETIFTYKLDKSKIDEFEYSAHQTRGNPPSILSLTSPPDSKCRGKRLKFKGEILAQARASWSHAERSIYTIIKTTRGDFVCVYRKESQWLDIYGKPKADIVYAARVETIPEIIKFFGVNGLAFELYRHARIDIDNFGQLEKSKYFPGNFEFNFNH